MEDELTAAFIVSEVEIVKGDKAETEIEVSVAEGEKCARCWMHSKTVGADEKHPTLCARCAGIVG